MKHSTAFLGLLFLFLLTSSCRLELFPNNKEMSLESDSLFLQNSRSRDLKLEHGATMYTVVDNLKLREQPELQSRVITKLHEGVSVVYLGEESDTKVDVEINGVMKSAPFYKIKTEGGEVGWAFAGALDMEKPDITYYRAVVAFFDESQTLGHELISEWSVYSSEALDAARKAGMLTFFVDKSFDKVLIKDKEGNVLEELNLENTVKKHGRGIVCIEKGKKPHLINFEPSMAEKMMAHFQLKD